MAGNAFAALHYVRLVSTALGWGRIRAVRSRFPSSRTLIHFMVCFTLDRFFTVIRLIDVAHTSNLLMFGERGAYCSSRDKLRSVHLFATGERPKSPHSLANLRPLLSNDWVLSSDVATYRRRLCTLCLCTQMIKYSRRLAVYRTRVGGAVDAAAHVVLCTRCATRPVGLNGNDIVCLRWPCNAPTVYTSGLLIADSSC